MNPLERFTETAILLHSPSMSTFIGKTVAVSVANPIDIPHTVCKNDQFAEISKVTPEQNKILKRADRAVLRNSPGGDSDLP